MRRWRWIFAVFAPAFLLAVTTARGLHTPPRLDQWRQPGARPLMLDREGHPLRHTFDDSWNLNQQLALAQIPPFVISAVLTAEDQDFYQHSGVDWRARLSALWLNLRRRKILRGASSISEQSVRMLHPRPRSLWSKWLEGWEAVWLERRNSKNEILSFYLNQIPFAAKRRGLVQGAKFYFDRDLSTLSKKEVLALAVLIRSPSRLGQPRSRDLEPSILRLASALPADSRLDTHEWNDLITVPLQFSRPQLPLEAPHFVAFAEDRARQLAHAPTEALSTTLDPGLQTLAQQLLDEALRTNPSHRLNNAAVIVADHQNDEVLAWAIGRGAQGEATAYNSALTARQPGSSLKPFLYTMAFEQGYSPESKIEDSPLSQSVGSGMHRFRNYSRIHYGWISMREALANSLNIPAVRLLDQIGTGHFLTRLRTLGLTSLEQSAEFYGEGLALGNGEVPLWQMLQAYSTLARNGLSRPLRVLQSEPAAKAERVFNAAAAARTTWILSDPHARRREFGHGGTMTFPVPTAVKTGTSTDFRDAWAFAYNYKFVIGVWMGNLSNQPTEGLTGSAAPMMVARALMNRVLIGQQVRPLAHTLVLEPVTPQPVSRTRAFQIVQPAAGSNLAFDPRIPASSQSYLFSVEGFASTLPVKWFLNDQLAGESRNGTWLWPVRRGRHELRAVQLRSDGEVLESRRTFFVR